VSVGTWTAVREVHGTAHSLTHRRKTAAADGGTLSVCDSAVLETPDEVGRGGEPGGGETDERTARAGDVA
jgi:hypothetical protein